MSDDHDRDNPNEGRLASAYHRMLDRARELLDDSAEFSLREALEDASRRAVEFGELTRGEAEEVAAYLRRDLHDAGAYLSRSGRELRDWARIDLTMVEQGLLDLFTRAADRSRIEFETFERELRDGPVYRSGEMTGPGTLRCPTCGQTMHFHAPGRIPPCPRCHATEFRRPTEGD